MRLIDVSRWLNHHVLRGSKHESVSGRAMRSKWYIAETLINFIFRDKAHCAKCFAQDIIDSIHFVQEENMKKVFINACCARCEATKFLSRHAVLPRRFGGSHQPSNVEIYCRHCHSELETIITFVEGGRQLTHEQYRAINFAFRRNHGHTNRR